MSTSIAVDEAMCDKLATLLAKVSIPPHQEDIPIVGFELHEIGNFYLVLVAICHQTQELQGIVDGSYRRGWDYLSRKFETAARANRQLLNPEHWCALSPEFLIKLFHDDQYGNTLTNPSGRAALIQDLGKVMQRNKWSALDDLYSIAQRHIAGPPPNLQDLLAKFHAYDDPVRKKTFFLLGLMANNHVWTYADEKNLGPPVDYHEVRGHLRLGTVVVRDPSLREKLLLRHPVTKEEDIAIRQGVYDAIMYVARQLKTAGPMNLHYLFWNIFRNICLRDFPYRKACPNNCGLPDRYTPLLDLNPEHRQCPFVTICAAAEAEHLYVEHTFETDWY